MFTLRRAAKLADEEKGVEIEKQTTKSEERKLKRAAAHAQGSQESERSAVQYSNHGHTWSPLLAGGFAVVRVGVDADEDQPPTHVLARDVEGTGQVTQVCAVTVLIDLFQGSTRALQN